MAASGTLVIRFIGDLKEFERSTAALSAKLNKMGTGLTKAVSLPLIGAGVAAAKLASDFEDSMSKIEGLVGASGKQIKTYSKVILTEGPKWGKAPKELADALYFVTSSGFQGAKALDILKQSAKASTAGLGETQTVADLVTSAMNAYKKSNLGAGQAVDILAKAVKLGKLESEEFAGQMGQVLPVASAMGVKFDEVSAALASMSMSGTNASEGTTQLRAILSSLLKPTKDAEKTLASMGLSSEGLRKQIADKGLLSVLQTLADKFKGNTAATASVFGNIRALTGVMNLMGENSATTRDVFAQMANATGSMDAAFEAASKTAQFKFDKALATIKASAIQLGSQILPLVGKGLDLVARLVERGMAAWKGLSPEMQKAVGAALAFLAALGPTLLVLGKVVGLVSMFANPLGLVVVALTALGAALAVSATKFDGVREAVMTAVRAILPTIKSLGDAFMREVIPAFRDLWSTIQKQLVPVIKTLLPILTPVAKFIITVLGQAVIGAIKGAIQFLEGFINVIAGVVKLVKALIHGDWKAAWEALKQIVGGILDAVIGAIKVWLNVGILGIFKQGLKKLITGWKAGWDAVKNLASGAFKAVDSLVATVWKSIGHAFTHAWSSVLRPVLEAIVKFLTSPIRTAFNGYRTLVETVWNAAKTIISGAWNIIRGHLQAIITFFKNPLHNAFTGFKTVVDTVWGAVRGIITRVWTDGVKPVFQKIADWMGKDGVVAGAFKAAVGAIRAIWDGIKEAARKPVAFVVNTVWNNGLRKVINAIPGHGDIAPLKFARGGPVTGGTRGKDSVLSLLMPGEHVLTAEEVSRLGGQAAVYQLRKSIRRGETDKWDLPAFATGGGLDPAAISRAQSFARSQVGKPYVWGGVGPGGYDCSGFMSAITNVLRGNYAYSRVGATANFPWAGFAPGVGQFTIGSTKSYGSSGVGHMAGTLAGLNVESAGGIGVRVGSLARGYSNPNFTTVAHLGAGGKGASAAGLFMDAVSTLKDIIGKVGSWFSALSGMGGWGGLIKDAVGSIVGQVKDWAFSKIPGLGKLLSLFDNGGILRSGALGMNLSGKPERVLDPRTTANFEALALAMTRITSGGTRFAGYSAPAAPAMAAESSADATSLDDLLDELSRLGDRIEAALARQSDAARRQARTGAGYAIR